MSRVHRTKEGQNFDSDKLIILGGAVESGSPLVQIIRDWAEKRQIETLKDMTGAAMNKDVSERMLGVYFGRYCGFKDDFEELLRLAQRKYIENKIKE